jgi:hypothetical protein
VSQLKKAVLRTDEVSTAIIVAFMLFQPNVQPIEVFFECLVKCGSKWSPQVSLHWGSLPDHWTSWEPLYAMIDKFRTLRLGGKPLLEEGVMTHLLTNV